jgi:hypothetical protein
VRRLLWPRLVISITPDGAVFVHAGPITGGKEQSLGREVLVANVPTSPATRLRLRAHVAGNDPTVRLRQGVGRRVPEPPQWEFGAIDWTVCCSRRRGGSRRLPRAQRDQCPLTLRISDLTVTATDPTN